jgi:hypothetical protein
VLVITTALVVLSPFVTTRTAADLGGTAKAAKLCVCVPKTLSELMR